MNYKTQIELIYRVYVRQMENVDLRIDSLKDELIDMFHVRASFDQERNEDYEMPIRREDVEVAENKGYFLNKTHAGSFVAIRSLYVQIVCDTLKQAEEFLQDVNGTFPGTFAVQQIVREYFTDMQAV